MDKMAENGRLFFCQIDDFFSVKLLMKQNVYNSTKNWLELLE